MNKAPAVFTGLLALTMMGAPSHAADLIQGYRERPHVVRKARPAHRTVVVARAEECSLLRIDYRFPYEPHAELVNVCYPPVDLRPAGFQPGSSGFTPGLATTESSFATSQ